MTGRAIVTGGSSGIGAATARLFAQAGYDVAITYRGDKSGADEVTKAIRAHGGRAFSTQLDLTEPEAGEHAVDVLVGELDGIDVLVNNAGVNPRSATLDGSFDDWRDTLNANLIGPWGCARTAARSMIATNTPGRIVNVTSVLAFVPLVGGGPYCAAKAGLEMLTKVMALELAAHDIRVNAVAPGHTLTPMNYSDAELTDASGPRPVIPMARAASADEIARAVVFLADRESSYATGASLLVDGGLSLASGPQQLQDSTGLPASARPEQ